MPSTLDPKDVKAKRLQYLKDAYGIIVDQDEAIEDALIQLNTKVEALSKKGIKEAENSIINAIAGFLVIFTSIIKKYNKQMADVMVGHLKTSQDFDTKADKKKFDTNAKKVPNTLSKNAISKKQYADNKSTEQRIKTIYSSSQKTVKNIIALGIKKGLTDIEIARQIQVYLKPSARGTQVSPFEYYRQRYDTATVPKDLRGGSVEYNALRIARTEIATAMREAVYEANKGRKDVIGYRWLLSPSHPLPDICDVYAEHNEGLGKGVWSTPPSTPHPNCYCYIEPVKRKE